MRSYGLISLSSTSTGCGNATGSLSATVSGGIAPYTYLWSNLSGFQNLTGLSAGLYSVTVTDKNGCASAKSDSVNIVTVSNPVCLVTVDSTSTKNVLVWDKPVAGNIASFRIYRNISSVFTQIGSVPYSSLSTYTDFNIGVDPNITSYQYKITVVDTCGNESAKSSFHKTIHVAVSPASPCGYNLFWNDYIGFPVSKYRILRDTTGNYNWQVKDSVSFGNNAWTDNSCNLPPNTSYLVEVIVPSGGCTASLKNPEVNATTINTTKSNSYKINSNPTGINENTLENSVSIYPNPSSGKFQVYSLKFQVKELEVYNLYGEKVYSEKPLNPKSLILYLDVQNGIYFLKVISDNGTAMKKVVVAH